MPRPAPVRALVPAIVLAALAAGSGSARADDRGAPGAVRVPEDEPAPAADLSTAAHPPSREALERGLAWLAARQEETVDGSLPRLDAREWAPVGVTALSALAFMAAGNSPGRGPYGDEVARAIDWLLSHVDLQPGSPEHGYVSRHGDALSRMHGHGFATLALAEAYGMSPKDERLRRALEAAVGCIERSQAPEGGWSYDPRPSGHEGSVTICLVQALRAARNVGVAVDAGVIARAEDYVRALQNDAGLFRYQLDREDATVALTAASVSTLNAAGRYDDPAIREGLDAIHSELARRATGGGGAPRWPVYERLYLAQALWQLTDPSPFARWWTEERERVVRSQAGDGSWSGSPYGPAYATAVHCLVLSLPDGLLPIFQR